MAELTAGARARVEDLLGDRVVTAQAVSRGYTPAARWRITLASGRTAFVKMGTTDGTAANLRAEAAVYRALAGPFMAALLGWEDHARAPLLVLEDLGDAEWPPPWTPALTGEVLATLDALHAARAPLAPLSQVHGPFRNGWEVVAEGPAPFLRLGLVSGAWLAGALPALAGAAALVSADGPDVVHLDVRSDNLCRARRGLVLVDWACACLGNATLDTGFWLPSLEAEGGPPPEAFLPGHPEIAAFVSGYFASRAGLPAIPDAPGVRAVQL